jgi:hypothetical protein
VHVGHLTIAGRCAECATPSAIYIEGT